MKLPECRRSIIIWISKINIFCAYTIYMPRKVLFALFLVLFSLITIRYALNPDKTQAAISACSVTVGPNFQNVGSSGTLSFGITNNDESSNSIRWIKITAPSSNFVITNATGLYQSSAEINSSATEVTIKLSGLSPAEYGEYYLSITTGDNIMPAQSFAVQVSDTDAGDNPVSCSGDTGVSIPSPGQEIINISNLLVSFTDTSAVISWNTDANATSQVEYGTTNQYGSTKTDSSLVTTHSVNLTGLSSSTVYHFRVTSVNADNDTAQLTDNTFTTAAAGTTTTSTVTVTTAKTISDTTLPGISINTIFSKPYETAPVISGVATDNSGVSQVEYSIDGGKNWIPVDDFGKTGAKSTTFSFLPSIIDDGNYDIKVRATDSSGNKTVSKTYALVIDRLQPRVGGVLFSLGPMVLLPDVQGNIFTIEGLDTKVTLSAVGGPIKLDILSGNQTFSFVRNIESGLWSGVLSFVKHGIFSLATKSVDGANNSTEGTLGTVISLEAGRVVSGETPLKEAKVSVYAFESGLGEFLAWNAAPYGQESPQDVGSQGEYKLILPPGKYYLEVSAPGYSRVRTSIFEISRPTPITQNFSLNKRIGLHLGRIFIGLPDFKNRVVDIQNDLPEAGEKVSTKAGAALPDFLFESEEQAVSNISLLGKPTVLTFISTWAPESSDQLSALEAFAEEFKEINVYAVAEQEGKGKVETFKKVGGYEVEIVADSDGVLIEPLSLSYFPSHVFVDRKGVIQKVVVGFLSKEEIVQNLLN